jgi:hypothetical protein
MWWNNPWRHESQQQSKTNEPKFTLLVSLYNRGQCCNSLPYNGTLTHLTLNVFIRVGRYCSSLQLDLTHLQCHYYIQNNFPPTDRLDDSVQEFQTFHLQNYFSSECYWNPGNREKENWINDFLNNKIKQPTEPVQLSHSWDFKFSWRQLREFSSTMYYQHLLHYLSKTTMNSEPIMSWKKAELFIITLRH